MGDPRSEIPPKFLAFADRGDDWATWMRALPRLVRDLLTEWELVGDGPPTHGECALVLPVRTRDRTPAVLKLGWPHEEAEFEYLALRLWAGDGAVRLLRADPRRSVMLLERASTRDLTTVPLHDACEVVAALYPRLHLAAPPQLQRLSALCGQWSKRLLALPSNVPVPRRYVEQAAALARDFAADDAADGRLIHSDLHFENVLASHRQDWLAIDPKPLSGDPHAEIAPLLWNRWPEIESAYSVREAIRERFLTVVEVAGFDEDRARDWVIVRMMVNAMWELEEPSPPSDEKTTVFDEAVLITKAVQD